MKYQDTKPTDEDLFESKSHDSIAKAIAQTILENPELNTIGIEGALGSGKSTIVNIVKQLLQQEKENEYHFIVFDLDNYHTSIQSTLVKKISSEVVEIYNKINRDFAETENLAEEYQSKKKPSSHTRIKKIIEVLLDYKKKRTNAQKEIKEITTQALGHKTEYSKSTTSSITPETLLFAVFLVLIPNILSGSISYLASATDKSNLSAVIAFFVWLTLILLSVFIFSIVKKYKFENILKQKTDDSVSEEVVISKEIGALEVEEAVTSLAKVIPEHYTLVIVFDNIDRLTATQVKLVWSELETYTSIRTSNIKILIPYSLESTIKSLEASCSSSSFTAREYILKRLSVIFTVPPLITVDWENRFKSYYHESLNTEEGLEEIISLIKIWHLPNIITPRFMKTLLNRIFAKLTACTHAGILNIKGQSNYIFLASYLLIQEFTLHNPSSKNELSPFDYLLIEPNKINAKRNESNKKVIEKIISTQYILEQSYGEWESCYYQLLCIHYNACSFYAISEYLTTPIQRALSDINAEKIVNLKTLYGFENIFNKEAIDNPIATVKLLAKLLDPENQNWTIDKSKFLFSKTTKLSENQLLQLDDEFFSSLELILQKKSDFYLGLISNSKEAAITRLKDNSYEKKSIELKKLVKVIYNCSKVLNEEDNLTEFISPELFVTGLWREQANFSNWKLDDAISSFKPKYSLEVLRSATIQVVQHIENIENMNQFKSLVFKILPFISFGEVSPIDINLSQLNRKELWEILPLTKTFYTDSIQLIINEQDYTSTELERLTAVSLIEYMYYVYGNKKTNIEKQLERMLATLRNRTKQYPGYKKYLVNYLACTEDFFVLIKFAKTYTEFKIEESICELIQNDRVKIINMEDALSNSYVELKSIAGKISISNLLDWLATFELSPPADWDKKLIEDLTANKNDEFLAKVKVYLDSIVPVLELDTTTIVTRAKISALITLLTTHSIEVESIKTLADKIKTKVEQQPEKFKELDTLLTTAKNYLLAVYKV